MFGCDSPPAALASRRKAGAALALDAQVGVQELDRHLAVQRRIARAHHAGHAAAAERLQHLIAADLAHLAFGHRAQPAVGQRGVVVAARPRQRDAAARWGHW
jgi:hypothetical protein